MDLKDTYNLIAEDWFKDHQGDDWWVDGTDRFISLLHPGDEILDVGCGAGVKSRYLAANGLKVLGIDFSEKLIAIARRITSNAEYKVLDMRNVATLDRKFDGIFAQASLLHIAKKEIKNVIANLVERLNNGGYLYIAVKGIKPDGKEEDVLKEEDYGYPYERFFSYYSMDELKEYLTDLKLTIVYESEKIVGKTEWLQIIGKLDK